jgi:hypothetical protein
MTQNDKITIIIHTENETKLLTLLDQLHQHPLKSQFYTLQVNCKGYTPWTNPIALDKLTTLVSKEYIITPTHNQSVSSIVELISKTKTDYSLIIDESNTHFDFKDWDILNNTYLLAKTNDLLRCNQDTNYQHIKWFIADLISQKTKYIFSSDNTLDSERYNKKVLNPLFYERIIYVDGGLGDHVMIYPLLEKIGKDCYISCIYPFSLEHIKCKGFVDWTDELFGGYKQFVYTYGSTNNTPTIIEAFFKMYGEKRESQDILNYTGPKTKFENTTGKPLALVCISAAKIGGQESNKDWPEIRWFKLIYKLKQLGYHVIQVGSHKDNQIPLSVTQIVKSPYCPGGVDGKFLDKSIPELAGLIDESSLWLSVDTFFHHFASSIKPNVGICLTPFYNDHAKHPKVNYVEKDCGKDYYDRRWWLDSQQAERKECMNLITVDDVLKTVEEITIKYKIGVIYDVNEHNKHLLDFSLKNTKQFSDNIIINHSSVNINDNIKQLKEENCDFYIKLNADEIYEFKEIEKVIKDMVINNIDVGYTNVINYFKNLNYVIDIKDNFKPVIYKINPERNKTKKYNDLKCHNFTYTYDTNKDESFKDTSRKFYYYNITNILINKNKYNIIDNDIRHLKLEGLIKVTYYTNGPHDNCSNWRAYLPFDRFENGINYQLLGNNINIERDKCMDVIILNRPMINLIGYIRLMQQNKVKVISDFDDALPYVRVWSDIFIESYKEMLDIMWETDMIITTNEKLKYYFNLHTQKPIELSPNIVKSNLITSFKKENKDKIILGWYGSEGHLHNILMMNKAVLKILDEFDNVYLKLQTNNEEIIDAFKHPKTILCPYKSNFYEFLNDLDDIDINLAPLEEDYINLHKSDIRIQLAAIKGIPSVATNFSEYKVFGELKGGALLTENNNWYESLKSLVTDKNKIKELSVKAKETIDEYYNYNKWSKLRDKIIINLIENDKN